MFNLFEFKKNEVIFIISIIFIIFIISFGQIKTGEAKARDAQRKADAELVGRAIRAYLQDYQVVPQASESGLIRSCGYQASEKCDWGGGPMVDRDSVVYLPTLPRDPWYEKGWTYVYVPSDDLKSARIYIRLERKSDPAYKNDLTEGCGNGVRCNWYVQE